MMNKYKVTVILKPDINLKIYAQTKKRLGTDFGEFNSFEQFIA